MDKEELKKNIDKSTPEEDELNTQTTHNDITDQKSGDKNLDPEKKEDEKLTPAQELETLKDKLARTFAEMKIRDVGLKKKETTHTNMVAILLPRRH